MGGEIIYLGKGGNAYHYQTLYDEPPTTPGVKRKEDLNIQQLHNTWKKLYKNKKLSNKKKNKQTKQTIKQKKPKIAKSTKPNYKWHETKNTHPDKNKIMIKHTNQKQNNATKQTHPKQHLIKQPIKR